MSSKRPGRLFWTTIHAAAVVLLFLASLETLKWNDANSKLIDYPAWRYAQQAESIVRPLGSVNSYGLFRRMTGVDGRPELSVEVSMDGTTWREVIFKFKPTATNRAPQLIGNDFLGFGHANKDLGSDSDCLPWFGVVLIVV